MTYIPFEQSKAGKQVHALAQHPQTSGRSYRNFIAAVRSLLGHNVIKTLLGSAPARLIAARPNIGQAEVLATRVDDMQIDLL